ncbi:hypothetical protein [Spiroplasma endosymbiont of Dactylopius coccus]
MIQQHKNPQHFKLLNSYQISRTSVYQKIVLKSVAIPLISGLSELIPNRFEIIRKICNMATGGCLISSGVAMGINNDFNNAYAVPTIVAGAREIIHNLLPMETTNHNQEMQETSFTNETRRLINSDAISNHSQSSDVLYERLTTYDSL